MPAPAPALLPTTPRTRFGIRFVILARAWRRGLDDALAGLGLTDATWAPLMHLAEFGDGISQKDLAWRVGIDGSSLVRLLDILNAHGFIERRTDAADRRTRRIFLTPAGHAAMSEVRAALLAVEDEMLADVSDAELEAALRMFERIGARLERMQAERKGACGS